MIFLVELSILLVGFCSFCGLIVRLAVSPMPAEISRGFSSSDLLYVTIVRILKFLAEQHVMKVSSDCLLLKERERERER